jgi:hypothetical protein
MDCRVASLLAMTVLQTCSPDERSDIRGGIRVVPDVAALIRATKRYDFSFSRRDAPGVLQENVTLEIRGRREDRVRAAPAVSRAVCIKKCCTRAYRFSGEHPAFPAQWLYGLYDFVLVTGFLATIALEQH